MTIGRYSVTSVMRATAMVLAAAMAMVTAPIVLAEAAACERWSFGVSQEEEGRTPSAGACAFDDGGQTRLDLLCFGRQINVRYTPRIDRDFGNQRLPFVFETEASNVRLRMPFEGLDGAFTAYLGPGHPIFELLMSGKRLNVYLDRENGVPERRFRLGGSRASITRLLRACRS